MSTLLLLEGRDLTVTYPRGTGFWRRGGTTTALKGASFTLQAGESLAVVGESGSGKSTLARAVLRLVPLAGGQVLLQGEDLAILTPQELRQRRRILQMIFQDPLASLDPRMRIEEILAQPLRVFEPSLTRRQRRGRAEAALKSVGLEAAMLERYPHEFSGGQAQRIGIARALIAGPAVLVCDEPVSALDVSIRAQVLELLDRARREQHVALLFIAHDLSAVRFLCERTLVLFNGQVVEQGPTASLFAGACHPYTRALLAAALVADPHRERRAATSAQGLGIAASPAPAAQGCPYATRCPQVEARCREVVPLPRHIGDVEVACHRAGEI